MLIRKGEQALATMIRTTLVFTTLILIADPDREFSDKANITCKGFVSWHKFLVIDNRDHGPDCT